MKIPRPSRQAIALSIIGAIIGFTYAMFYSQHLWVTQTGCQPGYDCYRFLWWFNGVVYTLFGAELPIFVMLFRGIVRNLREMD